MDLMDQSRRKFLGLLGGSVGIISAGVGGIALANRRAPDEFTAQGYRFRWSGWRDLPNQIIRVGHWLAWQDGPEPSAFYVAVAPYGCVQEVKEMHAIDMRLDLAGRRPTTAWRPEDWERARAAALRALMADLDERVRYSPVEG